MRWSAKPESYVSRVGSSPTASVKVICWVDAVSKYSGVNNMSKCYMCDDEGITREHAPPLSFFPAGYRTDLITVPSCNLHNTKNSMDVEYVRNVIVFLQGGNSRAEEIFLKAERSIGKSPKLFSRTFSEFKAEIVKGEETGSFRIDLGRVEEIMRAIAFAMYFNDHGKRYDGEWRIFSPSLGTEQSVYQNEPDGWGQFREMLDSIQYGDMPVSEPEVFKYAIYKWDEERFIYRFVFYENFIVNVWTLPVPKVRA